MNIVEGYQNVPASKVDLSKFTFAESNNVSSLNVGPYVGTLTGFVDLAEYIDKSGKPKNLLFAYGIIDGIKKTIRFIVDPKEKDKIVNGATFSFDVVFDTKSTYNKAVRLVIDSPRATSRNTTRKKEGVAV